MGKENAQNGIKKRAGFIRRGLNEFKTFAMRGNVIDLAVGVIIGGAFNKVVGSIVGDLVSPIIGLLIGNVDMSEMSINFKDWFPYLKANIEFKYGAFFTTLIDFVLTAFSVFLLVKIINALRAKPKLAEPAPPPKPTKDCPYCLSSIPEAATRCPHCTSHVQGAQENA